MGKDRLNFQLKVDPANEIAKERSFVDRLELPKRRLKLENRFKTNLLTKEPTLGRVYEPGDPNDGGLLFIWYETGRRIPKSQY